MRLTIRKPSYFYEEVQTLKLKWLTKTESKVTASFKCSACGDKVGNRRIGIAWIRDKEIEYSVRLCEPCGIKAEKDLGDDWSRPEGAK